MHVVELVAGVGAQVPRLSRKFAEEPPSRRHGAGGPDEQQLLIENHAQTASIATVVARPEIVGHATKRLLGRDAGRRSGGVMRHRLGGEEEGGPCKFGDRVHKNLVPMRNPSAAPPNGSRLSCGRKARGRKAVEPQTKRLAGEATQFLPTCQRPAASSAC